VAMREVFEQCGVTADFDNASRARIFLATSAFPFLTAQS